MINNFDECLESVEEKHFFIQDGSNQKPAFIVKEKGEFEVINHTSDSINFLKTDSCISDSNDTKRCDCAVFNNDTFCFIELKCIRASKFTTNRKKAETQLEATIDNFKDEDILSNKNLEAYVCLNCKIDENDGFESITQRPRNKDKETHFLFNLNTRLYYATKKEFN